MYLLFFQKYEPAAKSALKKFYKIWARDQHKAGDKAKKEAEDAEKRAKNLEEAKKIVIQEDASKPVAKEAKICHLAKLRGERIKVYGWVHRLRRQGKSFYLLNNCTVFKFCGLFFLQENL